MGPRPAPTSPAACRHGARSLTARLRTGLSLVGLALLLGAQARPAPATSATAAAPSPVTPEASASLRATLVSRPTTSHVAAPATRCTTRSAALTLRRERSGAAEASTLSPRAEQVARRVALELTARVLVRRHAVRSRHAHVDPTRSRNALPSVPTHTQPDSGPRHLLRAAVTPLQHPSAALPAPQPGSPCHAHDPGHEPVPTPPGRIARTHLDPP